MPSSGASSPPPPDVRIPVPATLPSGWVTVRMTGCWAPLLGATRPLTLSEIRLAQGPTGLATLSLVGRNR
jgi:hypothetical protein